MFGIIDFESRSRRGRRAYLMRRKEKSFSEGLSVLTADSDSDSLFSMSLGNEIHTVIFDGNIENSEELSKELKRKMPYMPSEGQSTAQIIAQAYAVWGGNLPEKIEGEYAMAVYSCSAARSDSYPTRLFLSCDRFGAKKLSYCLTDDGKFIFSTDIKKLLSHSSVNREVDLYGIWQMCYLSPAILPEKSYFRDIYELGGGYCAYLDCRPTSARRLMKKKYWHIDSYECEESFSMPIDFSYIKEIYGDGNFEVEPRIPNTADALYEDMRTLASIGCLGRYDGLDIRLLHYDSYAPKILMQEGLGLTLEACCFGGYLNSFFPWIYDPYQKIELFWGDVFHPEEGMNRICDEYKKSLFEFGILDSHDPRTNLKKRVCLSLKHLYPEALRLVRGIEKIHGRKINFGIDRRLSEDMCARYEKYLKFAVEGMPQIKNKNKKTDPEHEMALRSLCAELSSGSGNKIFDFTDRKKLWSLLRETAVCDSRSMSSSELIEWLCRVEIWLEEYGAEIKIP